MKWYSWYFDVVKNKYAAFDGRARRKEFWYFMLVNIIIIFSLNIIENLIGTYNSDLGMGILQGIYYLATLVPALAVSIRRLHDSNLRGWWMLLGFIPIVGALILIILYVRDSTPEENKYGRNPKTPIHQ